MQYGDSFIYLLQKDYSFEYMFAWGGEIFQQEVILKPESAWRALAWRLGFLALPYTGDQYAQGEQVILSGAMKSIDELSKNKTYAGEILYMQSRGRQNTHQEA